MIIFDIADTEVYGGDGFDRAVGHGDAGVSIDLDALGFEAFAGTSQADGIDLSASDTGAKIIWSGGGADVIRFHSDPAGDWQAGIHVVNLPGLTEAQFRTMTIESLGLAGLDLSRIDAIIVNPDAEDRYFIDGRPMGTQSVSEIVTVQLWGWEMVDEATVGIVGYHADAGATDGTGVMITEQVSQALGVAMTLQGGWDENRVSAQQVGWVVYAGGNEDSPLAFNGAEYGQQDIRDRIEQLEEDYTQLQTHEYEVDGQLHVFYTTTEVSSSDPDGDPTGGVNWFVAGGHFDELSLFSGSGAVA